jgi:hypothetical protein
MRRCIGLLVEKRDGSRDYRLRPTSKEGKTGRNEFEKRSGKRQAPPQGRFEQTAKLLNDRTKSLECELSVCIERALWSWVCTLMLAILAGKMVQLQITG